MRYHYEKPQYYSTLYGKRYICEHPIYDACTLYLIGNRGLAVIRRRRPGGVRLILGLQTKYICILNSNHSLTNVPGRLRTDYTQL